MALKMSLEYIFQKIIYLNINNKKKKQNISCNV